MMEDFPHARYEFDLSAVHSRLDLLRRLLGPDIALAYAIKANPFLVRGVTPYVERLEICSPGECRICDNAAVPTAKTVISGVYKTPAFLEALVSHSDGRIYTVESLSQFQLFDTLARKHNKPLSLLLRLTNGSQFGINSQDIVRIVSERDRYPHLHLRGIQFFSGTQKTSLKKLQREISQLDALLTQLKEEHGYCAEELEYGPGLPVAYFGEELDETALIQGLAELLHTMAVPTAITLELGRSIAACCGSYYTPIVDRKQNGGQNYLLVDGGMHHISYFGQYMGMRQPPIFLVGKETAPAVSSWNICGSLCSMNDILVKQASLPEPEVGDMLCFPNAGAYCMTEGISLFLSRDLPEIYMIEEDGTRHCIRPSFETYPLNSY